MTDSHACVFACLYIDICMYIYTCSCAYACIYIYMNFRKRSVFIIHINVVLCIVFLEVMRLCPSEGSFALALAGVVAVTGVLHFDILRRCPNKWARLWQLSADGPVT